MEKGVKMVQKTKNSGFVTSCIVTAIFSAIVIIGLFFHETWYDEAQAYLIARDASLHDILFYLPHYEGHPPLWHLMLRVGALGLPYPFALKGVQFILYEAVLLIIQFRSPFSRIMKAIIPTSFFLVYQYAVTSRPYILLTLACLLTAMTYKKRKEKPLRYILALILMCLSHSYGIAMAGGIVVADIAGECIRQRSFKKGALDIIKNKKLLVCYIVLLAAALLTIADIIPYSDTFGTSIVRTRNHGIPVTFLLCWIYVPSEVLFTSFSSEVMTLQCEVNSFGEMFGAAVVSLLVWAVLFRICYKRKMIAEMIVPYFFVSILITSYSYPHHFGVFLMYLLFIIWTAHDKDPITLSEFTAPATKAGISEGFVKKGAALGAAAFVCINVYWDVRSYYREIRIDYDPSPELAEWIKDNGLEDKKLLSSWLETDTNLYTSAAIASNAYFDRNIYYNVYNDQSYISHKVPNKKQMEEYYENLRSLGQPDFIVCGSPLEAQKIRELLDFDEPYIAQAFVGKASRIFKDKAEQMDVFVCCTKETYRELYGREYEAESYKKS